MVVIMDPFESCAPDGDTLIGLMAAALERGHRVACCTSGDVSWVDGRVEARVRAVGVGHRGTEAGPLGADRVELDQIDVVLVRTDPPVGADYIALTLLLEFARGSTLVVNDPRGLREANEKLYACRYPRVAASGNGVGRLR